MIHFAHQQALWCACDVQADSATTQRSHDWRHVDCSACLAKSLSWISVDARKIKKDIAAAQRRLEDLRDQQRIIVERTK